LEDIVMSTVTQRLSAIAACMALFPVHAHHSYAAFDRCALTTLDGEIVDVDWVNPHIVIRLRTQDVSSYRIEWRSLAEIERISVPQTLQAGDHVVILGHAMRDPGLKVLSLLYEIRRPRDGWVWQMPARPAPQHCAAG
jgi:hypothetical protein